MDFQLELFARRVVELQPHSIQLLSPTELTQYYIQTWTLDYHNLGDVFRLSCFVCLHR